MVYNVSFFRKKKDSDKFQNRPESRTGQKLGEIARFVLDRICYLAGRPSSMRVKNTLSQKKEQMIIIVLCK